MNECEPQARVRRYGEKTISNRGGSSGSNTGTKSLEPVSVVFKRIISSCLALKIECVCEREREREIDRERERQTHGRVQVALRPQRQQDLRERERERQRERVSE